jgi:hypothetical protein
VQTLRLDPRGTGAEGEPPATGEGPRGSEGDPQGSDDAHRGADGDPQEEREPATSL